MDTVVMIVKSLIVLAFLSLLLELILPKGSTKKYAKFVIGILVLVVMINPIIRVIGEDMTVIKDFGNNTSFEDSTAEIVASGNELRDKITTESLSEYEKEIGDSLQAELIEFSGIKSVSVDVKGNADEDYGVVVLIDLDSDNEVDTEKIRSITENYFIDNYGITDEQIMVTISYLTE